LFLSGGINAGEADHIYYNLIPTYRQKTITGRHLTSQDVIPLLTGRTSRDFAPLLAGQVEPEGQRTAPTNATTNTLTNTMTNAFLKTAPFPFINTIFFSWD
jgi:hypothetical protein